MNTANRNMEAVNSLREFSIKVDAQKAIIRKNLRTMSDAAALMAATSQMHVEDAIYEQARLNVIRSKS